MLPSRRVISNGASCSLQKGPNDVAIHSHKYWNCAEERILKQLEEDANPEAALPFTRFVRTHVGHPWMRAGGSADEALLLTASVKGSVGRKNHPDVFFSSSRNAQSSENHRKYQNIVFEKTENDPSAFLSYRGHGHLRVRGLREQREGLQQNQR
jgi:hypothetical protein